MRYILNYKYGSPIAIIKGGINDNKIIYVLDEDGDNEEYKKDLQPENEDDDMLGLFFHALKNRMGAREMKQLKKLIKNKNEPENIKMRDEYNNGLDFLKERKDKEIIINDGNVRPLFNIDKEREVIYIAGMSGSGKSYYISYLMTAYTRTYPDNNIFLFSEKEEDPAFNNNIFKRIKMNADLVKYPFKLEEFKNSFVIFDDYEDGENIEIEKEVKRLSKYVMKKGRATNVNMAYVSHLANDYKNTREILNEMTSCTIFPFTTNKHNLKYLLEKYFGFDKEQINKIDSLPSRWITIYKVPMMIVYDKGCYLIK